MTLQEEILALADKYAATTSDPNDSYSDEDWPKYRDAFLSALLDASTLSYKAVRKKAMSHLSAKMQCGDRRDWDGCVTEEGWGDGYHAALEIMRRSK